MVFGRGEQLESAPMPSIAQKSFISTARTTHKTLWEKKSYLRVFFGNGDGLRLCGTLVGPWRRLRELLRECFCFLSNRRIQITVH